MLERMAKMQRQSSRNGIFVAAARHRGVGRAIEIASKVCRKRIRRIARSSAVVAPDTCYVDIRLVEDGGAFADERCDYTMHGQCESGLPCARNATGCAVVSQ